MRIETSGLSGCSGSTPWTRAARAGVRVGVLVPLLVAVCSVVWTGPAFAETVVPTPVETATVLPTDVPTPTVDATATDTPVTSAPSTPDASVVTTPAPTSDSPVPSSAAPTATPTASTSEVEPTTSASQPGSAVLEGEPPAWWIAGEDPTSWIIAVLVLIASAALVVLLSRRPDVAEPVLAPPAQPSLDARVGTAAGLATLEAVGEAMIDAGYSVTGVHSALVDIARVNGYPATEIVVFPTALLISARGVSEVRTGVVSSGYRPLRLDQIDALDDVIRAARARPAEGGVITAGIAAMREMPSPYSKLQRVVAYSVLSAGLSVLLGGSWVGVGVAALLGAIVGTILMVTVDIQRQYQALVTVGLSFFVSVTVFTLTQLGFDPGVLAALIAPIVILLPGGLLTTGVIELATGQMMAGAGRLAAGTMQLMLLAAGVVAGAGLAGVPELAFGEAQTPIGPIGPWLAVAIFGIGIVIYQGGRPASIGWILLVLYVAYGGQVLGDVFFGGVLSAMIGAFVMTPVAYLVAKQPKGPAAFASFLPAFWMLVPGSLGLVGVTGILDGDSAGLTTLSTTASTMVAIMLGILAGSALGNRLDGSGTVAAV